MQRVHAFVLDRPLACAACNAWSLQGRALLLSTPVVTRVVSLPRVQAAGREDGGVGKSCHCRIGAGPREVRLLRARGVAPNPPRPPPPTAKSPAPEGLPPELDPGPGPHVGANTHPRGPGAEGAPFGDSRLALE